MLHLWVLALLERAYGGIRDDIASQMINRAKVAVVKNGSRMAGQYVYFVGYVSCSKMELPSNMANRWMLREDIERLMNTADPALALIAVTIMRAMPMARERSRESQEQERKRVCRRNGETGKYERHRTRSPRRRDWERRGNSKEQRSRVSDQGDRGRSPRRRKEARSRLTWQRKEGQDKKMRMNAQQKDSRKSGGCSTGGGHKV